LINLFRIEHGGFSMRAYSLDFRCKVVAAVDRGQSISHVARRFAISAKTVGRWLRRRDAGRLAADRSGPKGPVKLGAADDAVLRSALKTQPGLTLRQLRPMLSVPVVESTICRRLRKLGLSFKKSH
jgi:transposase